MNSDPTFLFLDSTAWTAITAIATSALVIVGGLTIISAGIDSRAKSRPNLVPELRLWKDAEKLVLFITNYGPSAAKNVKVTLPAVFDKIDDETEYEDNTAWAMQMLKKKYSKPRHLIGPGQSESNDWIFQTDLINLRRNPQGKTIVPSPDEKITISYDKIGWLSSLFRMKYKETFNVDYTQRIFDTVTTSDSDLDQQLKRIIFELSGIKQAIVTNK